MSVYKAGKNRQYSVSSVPLSMLVKLLKKHKKIIKNAKQYNYDVGKRVPGNHWIIEYDEHASHTQEEIRYNDIRRNERYLQGYLAGYITMYPGELPQFVGTTHFTTYYWFQDEPTPPREYTDEEWDLIDEGLMECEDTPKNPYLCGINRRIHFFI